IMMGFVNEAQEKVMTGEVTGVEAVYRSDGASEFIVRGYDKLHRLTRGRKQRTFLNMKDSAIADQIAGEAGLSGGAQDSKTVHDHVFQNNISDLQFLYSRAAAIGYEVFLDDNKLIFAPPQTNKSSAASVSMSADTRSMRFRVSTASQIKEVQVRGWDPVKKKEIIGKSKTGDEYSTGGAAKAGGKLVGSMYGSGGKGVEMVNNVPVKDKAHADAVAQGRLNELALNLVQGEAVVQGNPKLRAGKIVTFKDCDDTFDGDYYITRAVHLSDADKVDGGGYTTRLNFKSAGTNAK
ncbi:MAG: contractile injection system protein, VgrG/Pvc8 family, partial [Myxococcota bacterium]